MKLTSFYKFRGDDLGDLTETSWPDIYIPVAGRGDLTGEFFFNMSFIVLMLALLFNIKFTMCIHRNNFSR